MAQPTLQAMDDRTFLTKVDVLLEALERQTEGDPLGDWTVQSVKEEVRRRLLGRQAVVTETTPVTVKVEKFTLSQLVGIYSYSGSFRGTPSLITVTGDNTTVSHGFFTGAEVDAFLLGLETAQRFGFSFAYLPNVPSPSLPWQ